MLLASCSWDACTKCRSPSNVRSLGAALAAPEAARHFVAKELLLSCSWAAPGAALELLSSCLYWLGIQEFLVSTVQGSLLLWAACSRSSQAAGIQPASPGASWLPSFSLLGAASWSSPEAAQTSRLAAQLLLAGILVQNVETRNPGFLVSTFCTRIPASSLAKQARSSQAALEQARSKPAAAQEQAGSRSPEAARQAAKQPRSCLAAAAAQEQAWSCPAAAQQQPRRLPGAAQKQPRSSQTAGCSRSLLLGCCWLAPACSPEAAWLLLAGILVQNVETRNSWIPSFYILYKDSAAKLQPGQARSSPGCLAAAAWSKPGAALAAALKLPGCSPGGALEAAKQLESLYKM